MNITRYRLHLIYILVASVSLVPGLVSGEPVALECSAEFYAPAESVFCTWTNDTDSTVVAGGHPPFEICRSNDGEVICQGGLPWEFHLPPHSSELLSWDQRDCLGELVEPGAYIMRIYYVFGDGPPVYSVQDTFRILTPASTPEDPTTKRSSWGTLRVLCR